MNMLLQKLKVIYHRYPLITSLSVLVLFGATLTFATPPATPYTVGETLDPTCTPGSSNCTVTLFPVQTGNSGKYLTTDGTTTSWATISGSGISSLNGLAGATQTFATGTSGSDFGISSVGTTHTFNIPTASGSNRGLLSSADWNTFNNKISSPISLGTSGDTLYTPGLGAGQGDTVGGAGNNIFFGYNAGNGASGASYSNFLGQESGLNASNAIASNFIGRYSGQNATNAGSSNFLGTGAGQTATNASASNFIGNGSGAGATNAANSIFIGNYAGTNDTVNNTVSGWSILIGDNSSTGGFSNSIALGAAAINTATDQFALADTIVKMKLSGVEYTLPSAQAAGAGYVLSNNGSGVLSWANGGSSPISLGTSGNTLYTPGLGAGQGETTDGQNIFFGTSAGSGATNATYSNFFGYQAGQNATNATYSNFFGQQAGQNASSVSHSNFLGTGAGLGATSAEFSNFFGNAAGNAATGAANSNFFGQSAGYNATNAVNSNFFGNGAGNGATDAGQSNFFGNNSGNAATNAFNSNFFNENAGYNATDASYSNFFGFNAGASATNASYSNFFGNNAGSSATNATESNFLGQFAGVESINASQSNFLGSYSGSYANNASYSNFFGFNAGAEATNASNSIFFGRNAGYQDIVDNTQNGPDDSSILIGNYTNTGGFSNSVLLGSGTSSVSISNTKTNQFMLADTITDVRWSGVEYTLPSAQAGDVGYVLSNDGSGVLSWEAVGGSSPVVLGTSGTSLYTPGLGAEEGDTATGNNIFFGFNAGLTATNAVNSNFLGSEAGAGATNVTHSNFLGSLAGGSATDATYANFFGNGAGRYAALAYNSNFFGGNAGTSAVFANDSNFLGNSAGKDATNAANSNFLGYGSGLGAANASNSFFAGAFAGAYDGLNSLGSENAANSIFIGRYAGFQATDFTLDNVNTPGWSILIGEYSSTGGFSNSIALGANAINTATDQFALADSVTKMKLSGIEYTLPSAQAAGAGYVLSNDGSGVLSWAQGSPISITADVIPSLYSSSLSAGGGVAQSANIFLGYLAGYDATNATLSNFFGTAAGQQATNAYRSNFLGASAGKEATNASYSTFLGNAAGSFAANASYSTFLGNDAGSEAISAKNSTFVGNHAGYNDTVNNASSGWSVLLGSCIKTGGFSNSVLIGGGSTSFNCVGFTTYNSNTASNQFMLADSITKLRWRAVDYTMPSAQAGGTDYVLANDGSGVLSWADPTLIISDERLKSNIIDLGNDILSKLSSVRTVSYTLNTDQTQRTQIGFLAQDLKEYFPELVGNRDDGYYGVYYAQMTPVLVEAVKELNLTLTAIDTFAFEDTGGFAERLREFFESTTNGIRTIFVKEVQTDKLCVGTTCVTESQLQQLLNQSGQSGSAPTPAPEPEVINPEGNTPEETIPSEGSVPQEEIVPEPTPEPVPETVPEPAPEVVTQSEPPAPTE